MAIASGDMRSAIFSVASLPPSYQGPLTVMINDREMDIVARNAIFLLIFFIEEDPFVATEHVLHIWYSALITEACHKLLVDKLQPLVERVYDEVENRSDTSLLGKTWRFGESSLRLVLTRANWLALASYFDVPMGLTRENAQQIRREVLSDPNRADDADRLMYNMTPPRRLGTRRFRDDGLLLPFGQPRKPYTIPNP